MESRSHGLLLIDKPSGITSHDVVAQVRRILKIKEVGHTGTLDPLASGLMILLLGEATKLSQYILEKDKAYEVGFRLGVRTDTLDTTGKVIETCIVQCTGDKVISEALALCGALQLKVPNYSAVKVDGKKLYELAREGLVAPEILREMAFQKVRFIQERDGEFTFYIYCSKGSYIRAWVEELGSRLGCGAVMSSLRRVETPPFEVTKSIKLNDFKMFSGDLKDCSAFQDLQRVLMDQPMVRVNQSSEGLIKNGQISHDLRRRLIAIFDPSKDQVARIFGTDDERLLALVGLEKGKGFVIRRVFKYL